MLPLSLLSEDLRGVLFNDKGDISSDSEDIWGDVNVEICGVLYGVLLNIDVCGDRELLLYLNVWEGGCFSV